MASKVCNTPLVFLVLSLKNVLQVFLALLLINFRSSLNITKFPRIAKYSSHNFTSYAMQ